jgi:hypothetical protein
MSRNIPQGLGIVLRIGTGGGLLWIRQCTFELRKLRVISWTSWRAVSFSGRTLLHVFIYLFTCLFRRVQRSHIMAGIAQAVQWFPTGWAVGRSNPDASRHFSTHSDRFCGQSSLPYDRYGVLFQKVKRSGSGVDHPTFSSASTVHPLADMASWHVIR